MFAVALIVFVVIVISVATPHRFRRIALQIGPTLAAAALFATLAANALGMLGK